MVIVVPEVLPSLASKIPVKKKKRRKKFLIIQDNQSVKVNNSYLTLINFDSDVFSPAKL